MSHAHTAQGPQAEAALFALGPPGLEPLIERELRARGFAVQSTEHGGVHFRGDPWRANAMLATPTRILQRIAHFPAPHFDALKRGVAAVDWRPYGGLTPQVSCHKSRLYHSDAVAERIAALVAPGEGQLYARIVRDQCTLSVDTTGERLHRRGWRIEPGAAPLRETLAAALLSLAEWRPGLSLVDPMCGSGTLLIEAAVQAAGRWPGEARSFACAQWVAPSALPARPVVATHFVGGDRAVAALKAAQRNAVRAQVEVDWRLGDAARMTPPTAEGLFVCNPPYGRRIGQLESAWARIGQLLAEPFAAWRAALVVPRPQLLEGLLRDSQRAAPTQVISVRHGGQPIQLVVLEAVRALESQT